jgi:hypothetical protein
VKRRPFLELAVGVAAILAGGLLVAVSRRADDLGIGGPPGIGWKQVVGIVLGFLVATGGLVLAARALRDGRVRRALRPLVQPATVVPFILALAVYLGAFVAMDPPPTGDQPHYMIEAYSLAYDRDRDLRNDYADAYRFGPLFGPFVADAHYAPGTGKPTSVHNVGLPALLVPAVLVSHDPKAMRVELILFAALAAALLLGVLRRLRPRLGAPMWLVYVVWACVVFSLPWVTHSAQAYPEIPAILLGIAVVRVLVEDRPSPGLLVAGGVAVALLPWFHVRLGIPALAMVAALAWRAWRSERRPRAPTLVVLPLVVSCAALAAGFERWYGSPLPNAQYRGSSLGLDVEWGWRYSIGGLLSAEYGWLPFAPLHLLAVAGAVYLVARFRWWAAASVAVGAVYLLLVGSAEGVTSGFAYPGRLQFVLVPFAAVPLLALLVAAPVLRAVAAVLAVVSFALTIQALRYPDELLPREDPNTPELPLADGLAFLWPDFVDGTAEGYPDWPHATAWLLWLLVLGAVVVWVSGRAAPHRSARASRAPTAARGTSGTAGRRTRKRPPSTRR